MALRQYVVVRRRVSGMFSEARTHGFQAISRQRKVSRRWRVRVDFKSILVQEQPSCCGQQGELFHSRPKPHDFICMLTF